MKHLFLKKITLFLILLLTALIGIIISSLIFINGNGMDDALQGWVNLLWIPLIVVLLFIDRLLVRKFGTRKVNKIQAYILGSLILLFILNWLRLSIQ